MNAPESAPPRSGPCVGIDSKQLEDLCSELSAEIERLATARLGVAEQRGPGAGRPRGSGQSEAGEAA